MRMEEQLIRLVTEWSGEIPVSISPMSFGHTNQVFAAVFAHRELIVRTNTEPEVLAYTGNNLSILAGLGLPVPAVLAVDLTKKQVPWAYMILEKIPGQDLRDELAAMSREQMRVLAGQIISFQHQAAKLPEGKGYGWVPIGRTGPYASWSEIIERDYNRHLPHILDDIDQELIGRLASIKEHYEPYFKRVRPICFLDDVTIKNVIVRNGELQGIVDFDWVCYGDPLYMIGLTQTAVVSDIGPAGMPYIEELCTQWGADAEQRAVIDFYSMVHALQFIGFHKKNGSDTERRRLRSFLIDKIVRMPIKPHEPK
ncbi:phosphotransferase family protein [Paenibacillus ihbetae]|uniref:Aminoglycoside phosphotransferase n=1 Tax=Paenibacillus ihbetae TaxID=1870820 RepID=A0ABX3JXT2_9BACL|nr:aminoglycoside phosphotransferase family protein [Paenibacillus ihbetae]OOC62487.1 aminoglycoside phosphotransferase [Paenibacillus ihbetae]